MRKQFFEIFIHYHINPRLIERGDVYLCPEVD